MTVEEQVPLAPLTTFGLGGPARFLVRVTNVDELKQSLAFAKAENLKVLVLGGGSNVLVSDEGFDGLVIKIEFAGVELQETTLLAGAGESWDGLVARAVSEGLWGVENLSGIPGTVGGAVVQNIGAYGAALSQTLAWVEAYDRAEGRIKKLTTDELAYGYRASVFKRDEGRYIVLRAAFVLDQNGAPNDSYKDLAGIAGLNLAEIRAKVLEVRARKFPDLAREGAAGSFFLNPVVSAAEARALQSRFAGMPLFAMPETTDIKVPLGWILDKVLNLRGSAQGGARVFERQALVIVASRDARARDVRALAERIKKEVRERIGIEIEEEVKVIHTS